MTQAEQKVETDPDCSLVDFLRARRAARSMRPKEQGEGLRAMIRMGLQRADGIGNAARLALLEEHNIAVEAPAPAAPKAAPVVRAPAAGVLPFRRLETPA